MICSISSLCTKVGLSYFARMRIILHTELRIWVHAAIACYRKDAIALKIDSSAVQMDATYSARKVSIMDYSFQETLTSAPTKLPLNADNSNYLGGRDAYNFASPSTLIYMPATNTTLSIEESFQDLNTRLLKHIIEMMRNMIKGNNFNSQSRMDYLTSNNQQQNQSNQVWYRNDVHHYTYYSETEATTFSTKGMVKTSDGRELSFSLDLSMSRAFIEETQLDQSLGDVLTYYDPLVINMDVPTAAVTDQSFFFDINSDGTAEKIATLAKGSGFLAFDRNGDGIINDGSELFGTKSGDGFRDLAAYDSDGNGWIDENDEIYKSLKVWTKNYDGTDKLLSLQEADIGAIYLGNVSTKFDLKAPETNDTLAKIQSTGIFLHESTGEAGTIQHVDFSA